MTPPFPPKDLLWYFVFYHPLLQFLYRHGRFSETFPSYVRKDWKETWLPLIPVDKWTFGQFYLARHGNSLVIPKAVDTTDIVKD